MAVNISKGAKLICVSLLWITVPAASYAQGARGRRLAPAASSFELLSDADMRQQTGGAEPLSTSIALNESSVSGNQIGGVGATGEVSANSLANNSGLTTLIANSGNQVVISQSTVVNVFLH